MQPERRVGTTRVLAKSLSHPIAPMALPTKIAAELAAKLADVPTDQLAAELASIEGIVAQYRASLRLEGLDPEIEALVARAQAWTRDRPSASTVRALCLSVRVKKCKTSFDDEMADVSTNTTAADFDIQFGIGEHEGFVSGSMVDREGEIDGQLETLFGPLGLMANSISGALRW